MQAFNQLLDAISGLGTTGIIARLSGSTAAARTLAAGAGLSWANGDGVAGNPTISLSFASQAEAEAGTEATKPVNSLRVAQAIAALGQKGRVLLATKTASASATLDFTEFNNAVYRWYEWELESLLPGTDNVYLRCRLSTDAGATWDAGAGAYQYGGSSCEAGGTLDNHQSSSATAIDLTYVGSKGIGNAVGEYGLSGSLKLYNAAFTTCYTRLFASLDYDSNIGRNVATQLSGIRKLAQDTTGLRLLMSSGTIASGVVRMYGVQ